MAPNGKKHTVVGAVIYHIATGRVVERWAVDNTMSSLKQLGAIEYTEKVKRIFSKDV